MDRVCFHVSVLTSALGVSAKELRAVEWTWAHIDYVPHGADVIAEVRHDAAWQTGCFVDSAAMYLGLLGPNRVVSLFCISAVPPGVVGVEA